MSGHGPADRPTCPDCGEWSDTHDAECAFKMTQTAKHTPTPWEILDAIPGVHTTRQETGESYFDSLAPIVNAHDELAIDRSVLLTAVHAMLNALHADAAKDISGDGSWAFKNPDLHDAMKIARAALAKIEGAQ